jgi:hypothetical protein
MSKKSFKNTSVLDDLITKPSTTRLQTSQIDPKDTETGEQNNETFDKTPKANGLDRYTTYLLPGMKKIIQLWALQNDKKDYEIVIEAINDFIQKYNISPNTETFYDESK